MATNFVTALGASDIDTKQLVSDLVAAVREPRQQQIDRAKEKAEVAISSVALLKSALSTLQTAAEGLGSVGQLNQLSIANTDPTTATLTAGGVGAAIAGNHSLTVEQLAQPQRMTSGGFATSSAVVDASNFTIDITVDGTTETISITGGTTVSGVVSAINSAATGVTARLVNTGNGVNPYQIVLQGESGSDNAYTVSSSSAGVSFPTTLQVAQDAEFTLDGIEMTRSSNSVTDALPGITLTLNRVNATSTNLGVSYDVAGISASIERFVEAYNLVNDFITRATGLPNADDELAGTLQGNTVTRSLRNQLRNLMGSATSASGTDTTRWAELGVEFDRTGTLTFDSDRFTSVFESDPADAVKALSNDLTRPNLFSGGSSGLAGDVAVAAYAMVRSTGTLADIDQSYQTTLETIAEKQSKLDRDIERLTARYERQFSAMDAILARFKATAQSLESSLDFNNKD